MDSSPLGLGLGPRTHALTARRLYGQARAIIRSRERGTATLEWVGVTALAAVVILGVCFTVSSAQLDEVTATNVCAVKEFGCTAPAAAPVDQAGPANPPGDTGDRRNQEGQTRDGRRGRGSDKAPGEPGATPRRWRSSSPPMPWPRNGPTRHGNLSHYLGNTGEPLEQTVNRILQDVPSFQTAVDEVRTSLGETAVRQAKESGATGPVTFPISTNWMGANLGENQNWFYALGSITDNVTGQVTVYPPTPPGGAWRYETSTAVNIADQSNWDRGIHRHRTVQRADSELARLHLQGLAREYRNQGTSDTTTTEGTVP